MFSQRVKNVMERKNLLIAGSKTTVRQAAQLMAQKKMCAVMVVDGDVLVGIFTERDAVFRVVARGLDVETTPLADVMTPSPQTIDQNRTFGQALMLMHENGFRHVPVVVGAKLVGLVTSRNALDPDMEEFVSEAQRRLHIDRQA